MPTKWYECKLVASREIAPQTRLFTMMVLDVDQFSFTPGQFITFDLPIHEKRLHRWKSYSISNSPDGTNNIELCIVKNEGGLGTHYLFNQLRIGDKLTFKGPEGHFILPDSMPESIYFVCTGTGVAPFRSMLWELGKHPEKAPAIRLIFGTRTMEKVLFWNEWQVLIRLLPDFEVHIALSSVETLPANDYQQVCFYKGYVHQIYLHSQRIDLTKSVFYICGWQKMIDEAQKNLLNLGLSSANIRTELYG